MQELQKWHDYDPFHEDDYRQLPFCVVTRRTVAAPPDAVFDVLKNIDAWPRWVKAIRHGAWTSPEPHGVGSTRMITMKNGIEIDERFVVWKPNKAMGFVVVRATVPQLRSFGELYEITPHPRGCIVQWTFSVDAKPWWLRWMLRSSWMLFYLALGSVLNGLKRVVERTQLPPSTQDS